MAAYYNEFDHGAAAWLRELIKRGLIADGVVDERSILDVDAADLVGFAQCHFFAGIGGWSRALRLAGWPDDRPVWTGSPPCQPFSAAGKQLGRDDARHLAPHFIGLVGACRPPVLFGEQVASSAVFGGAAKSTKSSGASAPEWAWIDDLSDRLEAARYAVGAADIPAAFVGAPHIRQRTFFGAIRLADAGGEGLQGHGGSGEVKVSEGWNREKGYSSSYGLADGLADSASGRIGDEWEQCGGEYGFQPQDGGAGGTGHQGSQLRTGSELDGADAPESFWRDADWLFCRDAKWRPVESGTFPLDYGLPARVVRLRGYGNAIVPQAAAIFIQSFTEVTKGLNQ